MNETNDVQGQNIEFEDMICNSINEGKIEEAYSLIEIWKNRNTIYNDTIAIYEATVQEHMGNHSNVFDCISKGLAYNYKNYELYFMLGNYYMERNKNQAYLCYENAEFYCNNEDVDYIRNIKYNLLDRGEVTISPVSIVILSYNAKDITSLCLDSIRQYTHWDAYELVVIDNSSVDGSADWLKQYELSYKNTFGLNNIKIICNKENKGFPGGCNQGISESRKENDIFLLNNDTVVPPNSIFWLRMGLYESDEVGAVGSISNHANNDQMVKEKKNSIEEWFDYGIKNNIPMKYPYEKKAWLMGFAVMFKRNALDKVGYLDERFTPGNYEDNDIGFRFLKAGYTQLLCKNSFIYHFGSIGFRKNQKAFDELLKVNRKKLEEKHGIPVEEFCWVRTDILEYIENKLGDNVTILDIGCGLGATVAKLEGLYPNSKVYGIEKNEEVAKYAKNIGNIIQGDIEVMEIPFPRKSIDYIIFGNVLEYLDYPENTIIKMRQYLKDTGTMIISVSKTFIKDGRMVSLDKEGVLSKIKNIYGVLVKNIEENKIDYIINIKCV